MIIVRRPIDLAAHANSELGATAWLEITQTQIDRFAELTGDDHWVHVDIGRASRELPTNAPIAHGLFLLSLIPRLQRQLFRIEQRGAGLNYGYEKVRFTAPVPVRSRIRLRQTLLSSKPQGNGARIDLQSTIELEGNTKSALVAHGVLLISDADR